MLRTEGRDPRKSPQAPVIPCALRHEMLLRRHRILRLDVAIAARSRLAVHRGEAMLRMDRTLAGMTGVKS
jgi:hypothetical protein